MADIGTPTASAPQCPKCGSKWVAKIAAGCDSNNPAFVSAMQRGEIIMQSEVAGMDLVRHAWFCRGCGNKWGRPASG